MTLAQRVQTTGLAVPARRQYAPAVQRFNAWHKGGPITDDTIRAFFAAQKLSRRYSVRSLRLAKVALKAAWIESAPANIRNDVRFTAAVDALFRSIKTGTPPQHVQSKDLFSEEDIDLLIQKAPPKIGLFIDCLYSSGSRISELLSVELSRCKLHSGIYYCRVMGKGSRERDLEIEQGIFEEVRRVFAGRKFLFEHHGRKYSPQFMAREMKKHAIRILGRDIHPHALRHCRATHLLEAGNDAKGVSVFLGHSRVDTTLRVYSHTSLKPAAVIRNRNKGQRI